MNLLTSSTNLLMLSNHVPAMEIIINHLNNDDGSNIRNLCKVNKHFNTLLKQHYLYSILYKLKKYEYLKKHNFYRYNNIIDVICYYDDLSVLKYLYKIKKSECECECTTNAMNWAARKGHLEVVKYLFEVIKCGCTNWAMKIAAENGYLEIVKYLHEVVKINCIEEAMNSAAYNGHLEIVKYLHNFVKLGNNEYTKEVIVWATVNGHSEVVNYLHEVIKTDI